MNNKQMMRTIIIGCGNTMENGFGGPKISKYNKYNEGLSFYPHAIHTHTNCTTVDILAECTPSVVMDFCVSNLLRHSNILNKQKFDLIVLENLPYKVFRDKAKLEALVLNCLRFSSEIAQVIIPLITEEADYFKNIMHYFSEYFILSRITNETDLTLIYRSISSVAGRYNDEYIAKYKVYCGNALRYDAVMKFAVFKRF